MLMRWDPFQEMHRLQQDINRLFEGSSSQQNGFAETRFPLMDVSETEDEQTVRFLVPGLPKGDVHISLHQNVLTVTGEKSQSEIPDNARVLRRERSTGSFHRTLRMKNRVAEDRIEAQLQDGVLTIRLPYREEVKPRQVEVAVS
jgi:HSP20 family protein